jgi:hypothetical protein
MDQIDHQMHRHIFIATALFIFLVLSARSQPWLNGKEYYGIRLPLGNFDYGGPLFFEQYTFMGIDPNHLKDDRGVDYAEQTRNHTLIATDTTKN